MPEKKKRAPRGSKMKTDALGEIQSKQKAKDGHVHVLIRNVPMITKKRFKAVCELNGVSMRDVLVKFMKTHAKQQLRSKVIESEE